MIFVGAEACTYVTDNGMLRVHADAKLAEIPAPDILCVPGGVGVRRELDGLRATTHWLSPERLREHGASPTGERVVEQGRMITAAGVSLQRADHAAVSGGAAESQGDSQGESLMP